jgi:spore coat polysaccharide biosynthesis protein SpsF (cytidylyltransferase family)
MTTVAIIQVRMTSSRLPGKVLAMVAGQPLLYHVVRRARRARTLDMVVVATTDGPADDGVARLCEDSSVPYFRGSEDDVLDRYYQAANAFKADVIVRLTADCPLLDPAVIDKVVREFQSGSYDYVSNTIIPTYPDGLDTEVFLHSTLKRAWQEARLKSEREHVTPYIWKQPALFRLLNVENEPDLSALRWTVDEPQDLEFVRRVYSCMGSVPDFGMQEVLDLLHSHPELKDVNAGFERNEGYQESLREDSLTTRKESI